MEKPSLFFRLLRAFIKFIVTVFFHDITVDGAQSVPDDGACIFVGNHQNQFIVQPDRFLVAQKSMSGVVGFFARAFNAIPVARPQDTAKIGSGTISIEAGSAVVKGKGTTFTKDFVLDKHSLTPKNEDPMRIKEIRSDEEIILSYPVPKAIVDQPYKIFDVLDQSAMYSEVWTQLGGEGCIGIFPEGGSHDRSELLPLKAGVTLMALGAMEKYGHPIYIVPCGLNYFEGHRFRGNCLIEFGRYYKIPMSMVRLYRENKRQACTQLLQTIKEYMETVIVHAPDYDTLREIKLARKLYQGDVVLTPEKYIELHHRFLAGWRKFGDKPEVQQVTADLRNYLAELQSLGLRDKHIEFEATAASGFWTKCLIFLRLCLVIITLGFALPGALLNLPIGLYARYSASKHAAEALKKSDVKIEGKDVIASKKVVVVFKFILPLYVFYTLIVSHYFGTFYATLFFAFLPILSLATIRFAEEGIALAASLHAIMKIKWMYGQKIDQLRETREKIRQSLIKCVTSFGQELAGKESLDEWRIIKDDQLELPVSPRNLQLRAQKKKAFSPINEADQPIITDQEWNELKDIFG